MVKPKISILIPIYNGGEYLKLLIQNLLNQTFKDFEIICVEDGSTDGSREFLEEKATEDSRIKIVKRAFKGGTAVKGITYGFPYCNGEYFFYLSQDDLLDVDALEKMYGKAIKTDADIIIPDMIWYSELSENNTGIFPPNKDYDYILDGTNAFLLSLDWKVHGFFLQKMSFAQKIGWDDLYYNSCEYGTRTHLYNAKKIVFVNTKVYYRQENINSITKNKIKPFKMEVLFTDIRLLNFMINNGLKDKQEFINLFNRIYCVYKSFITPNIFNSFSVSEKKEANKILSKSCIEYLKVAFKTKKIKNIFKSLKMFFKRKNYIKLKYQIIYLKYKNLLSREFYNSPNMKKRKYFFKIYKKLVSKNIIFSNDKVEYCMKIEQARTLPCKVGRCTYCGDNVFVGSPETTIGKFCSLAGNITIGPGDHPLNYMSTSSFFYLDSLGWNNKYREIHLKPCHIGNDVWIGSNVFIKGGVKIGDGAVIAAGAVVVKDVAPYSVVGGVPAKVIKYRFNKNLIDDFLSLKWWDLDESVIKSLPFKQPELCIKILKDIENVK